MENIESQEASAQLEELKKQYNHLQNRFSKRKVIQEGSLEEAANKQIAYFKKNRVMLVIAYLLAMVISVYVLQFVKHLSIWISISLCLTLLASLLVELKLHSSIVLLPNDNADLLSFAKEMRKMKLGYTLFYLVVGIILLLWFILLISNFRTKTDFQSFLTRVVLIGLPLILAIVGYEIYRWRKISRVVDQIEKQPLKINRTVIVFGGITILAVVLGLLFKLMLKSIFANWILFIGMFLGAAFIIAMAIDVVKRGIWKSIVICSAIFLILLSFSILFMILRMPFYQLMLPLSAVFLLIVVILVFTPQKNK